jgi:hypothetical protein
MKTIYKYKLSEGLNELEIPYIKILGVIYQGFTPTIYAIVDTENPNKKLQVAVIGTGWEIEDNIISSNYIGTITNGVFVWHVFWK